MSFQTSVGRGRGCENGDNGAIRNSGSQGHCVDSVDRISDLPDSILTHILSFLPIKDVVATRILSQRWTFVWTTTSNLDFCFSDHQYREDKIVKIVNYVMLLHKQAYLNRFSLALSYFPDSSCAWINTWICSAVAKNVHDLLVSVKKFRVSIQAQRSLFSCEGLRSLELNSKTCISSKIVVSLPKLESLRLIFIYFENGEALRKLIAGCPVLKYLFIVLVDRKMKNRRGTNMVDGTASECIISSTSLTHLELYTRYKYQAIIGLSLSGIQLDTPSLEYVKLEVQIGGIIIQQSLTSLVEANIQLASLEPESEVQNSIVNAFRALVCAKTLTLSAQVIRAFSCCAKCETNIEFNRLTRLEVTIDLKHWSSLQDLIKFSDNLEILIIKKAYDHKSEDNLEGSNWNLPVPKCLSISLKTVSIDVRDGHHNELAMIDYILKHGSVLQVMKICFDESTRDFKTKFEAVKKISKLSKKSPVCKVEFC